MGQARVSRFPQIADGGDLAPGDVFYKEEVQLALRNRGMPAEGLRYDVTPSGMHYLLVHFDIPEVDVRAWRLHVDGLVQDPVTFSLDRIQRRPTRTIRVTMECAGNGRALLSPRPISQPWLSEAVSTAEWTGVPLREVLGEAGVKDEATEVVFTGLDQGVQGDEVHYYQRSLSLAEAFREEVLLAYQMNGQALQPQHGFPLRLIVPGWYGMASVKWLDRIEVVEHPFQGYQTAHAYRLTQTAEDPGEPVDRINVRALMIPPGIPDFLTRTRLAQAGVITLTGRAWAGLLSVASVEVSTDGGSTWSKARLRKRTHPFAWQAWSYDWDAAPGHYELCARATDADGNLQPLGQPWNHQGMCNNTVQRVGVVVE